MTPFKSSDPVVDLIEIIKQANPGFILTDPNALIFRSALPNATGKNTKAVLVGNGDFGVIGTMELTYDRYDLAKCFTKFGDTNHQPVLHVNGAPGQASNVFSVIDQVNNLLGVNFITSGKYAELTNSAFTYPIKGGVVTINIVGAYSADGNLPTAVRIKPGTVLALSLKNLGQKIGNALVNRVPYPFNNAGKLMWNNTAINTVVNTKKAACLALRNVDFTSEFGAGADATILLTNCTRNSQYSVYYGTLKPAVVAAINTKLAALGLGQITVPKTFYATIYGSWWSNWPSAVAPTAASECYNQIVMASSARLDTEVNKALFGKAVKLVLSEWGITPPATTTDENYVLSLN